VGGNHNSSISAAFLARPDNRVTGRSTDSVQHELIRRIAEASTEATHVNIRSSQPSRRWSDCSGKSRFEDSVGTKQVKNHDTTARTFAGHWIRIRRSGLVRIERQLKPGLPFSPKSIRVFSSANLLYYERRQQVSSRFHGAGSLFLM